MLQEMFFQFLHRDPCTGGARCGYKYSITSLIFVWLHTCAQERKKLKLAQREVLSFINGIKFIIACHDEHELGRRKYT